MSKGTLSTSIPRATAMVSLLTLAACGQGEPEPLYMFTARCAEGPDMRFTANSLRGNDNPEEPTLAYVYSGKASMPTVVVARFPFACKVWADSTGKGRP